MSLYDDKTLVAYVDGELDPREAWLVQVALERDPALRDKVRVMRETASVLRAAFSHVAGEVLPPFVDELLASAQPVPLRLTARSRGKSGRWLHLATAAAVALVIGVSAGFWARGLVSPAGSAGGPEIEAAQAETAGVLQVALEKKLSGSELTWTDERSLASVTVEPIRTYRNEDSTFCREYRETFNQPRRVDRTVFGLACRDSSGRWNVQYYLVPGTGDGGGVNN